MAKDCRADGPCGESDRVDRKRLQRADPGIGVREEELCENQTRDGAVKKEVIPLDRGPDCGGDHGAAKLALMLAGGKSGGVEIKGCHGSASSDRPPLAWFHLLLLLKNDIWFQGFQPSSN